MSHFPQHDGSTFAQIVSKTPKDKSARDPRFWLPVQRGCSDRERRILNNARERAALLGTVTSFSTLVTRSRDLPERPASVSMQGSTQVPARRVRRRVGALTMHARQGTQSKECQRLGLVRLSRISRSSFGPLRSLRLRVCRSSSVVDGSIRRSNAWPAISRAFAAPLGRAPVCCASGACSVAMIDLHSSQTMSAAS